MTSKPFHRRQWLNVQQAVNHLSAIAEESVTSADLADLAEERQLDLYWYRARQMLTYLDQHQTCELTTPLRLCAENRSDWKAIVDILRHRPALPAYEGDTPLLEDDEGHRLRITFDNSQRPEPFSGRWYPSLSELRVKRSDLEHLEPRLFSAQGQEGELQPQLLLSVIWQLEKLALHGSRHGPAWLAEQLARHSSALDKSALERILAAAEREGARATSH
ncbi:hypothetical protein [Microbulbifer thermotolerans]|uniref:Uncharacterized protein n=1 Tax=Microbulbifer thermotolerans TaxID=252514 RepID=A0A143HP56_MICTH|nr:hypothetical protein [Microbulbifer thermotolerans]AMX03276.1 hypothetical protein A3224_12415 [Microbulbifer thermotolerans]WKT59854.1 hypothetical protein Q2E61_13230 [Microbulbifer thermotolerans]